MPRSQFDLAEATEFVRHDFRSNFFPYLHDWELFERERDNRLAALDARIDGYIVKPTRELPIPKAGLLSRPAALPIIDD